MTRFIVRLTVDGQPLPSRHIRLENCQIGKGKGNLFGGQLYKLPRMVTMYGSTGHPCRNSPPIIPIDTMSEVTLYENGANKKPTLVSALP